VTYQGIIGNPKNRWFDKTTPTIVFENGLLSSNSDVSYCTDFYVLICISMYWYVPMYRVSL